MADPAKVLVSVFLPCLGGVFFSIAGLLFLECEVPVPLMLLAIAMVVALAVHDCWAQNRNDKQKPEGECGMVDEAEAGEAMEDKERENADLRAQLRAMQQAFQAKDDELLSLQEAQQTDMQQLHDQMSALDVEIQAKVADIQQLRDQMSELDVQLQAEKSDSQQLRDEVSALKADVQAKAAAMAREESLGLEAQLPEKDLGTQNSRDDNAGFKAQVLCEMEDSLVCEQALRGNLSGNHSSTFIQSGNSYFRGGMVQSLTGSMRHLRIVVLRTWE